jgi:hypothetical protein
MRKKWGKKEGQEEGREGEEGGETDMEKRKKGRGDKVIVTDDLYVAIA